MKCRGGSSDVCRLLYQGAQQLCSAIFAINRRSAATQRSSPVLITPPTPFFPDTCPLHNPPRSPPNEGTNTALVASHPSKRPRRCRSGVVVRLHPSCIGEPGSIPGGVAHGCTHVGIMSNDATGRRVFSGIFCLPTLSFRHCSIPHLRANQISSLTHSILSVNTLGRHVYVDCVYLGQAYSRIPKQMLCDNANMLVLFRMDDTDLRRVYGDHVNTDMTLSDLKKCLCLVLEREYGFFTIVKDWLLYNGSYGHGFVASSCVFTKAMMDVVSYQETMEFVMLVVNTHVDTIVGTGDNLETVELKLQYIEWMLHV
ncbi:hypothetical protein PR048_008446 [Dryococelus australis]|uniref:Uncharacterized protein n=1 Tax=Dryococelus australis TaxID=614101 RepID=A0ABQ9HXF4_9NEOP|nr:hypothetical protein PR048_008446 [Dryococelus australis]